MDNNVEKLINFSILEKEPRRIVVKLEVDPGLPSFNGHFPGRPVLPAVSIIDISLHLVGKLGVSVSHSKIEMKRSKFTSIVKPGQTVLLAAESGDGTNWEVLWVDENTAAKLARVLFVI